MPRLVKVFIASPSDVGVERDIANGIAWQLKREFEDRLDVLPIMWRDLLMDARKSYQHNIPSPAESDIVVALLWQRLGSPLPEDFKRADGTHYRSATLYEIEMAITGNAGVTPTLMVYRKETDLVIPRGVLGDRALVDEIHKDFDEVSAYFASDTFTNPDGTNKRAYHPFQTADEFAELFTTHLRQALVERMDSLPEGPEPDGPVPGSWRSGSPFVGLASLTREQADVFFGREDAVARGLTTLRANSAAGCRALFILGMSGVGKSSLAQAGIAPRVMRPASFPPVRRWRYLSTAPAIWGHAPCSGLAKTLFADGVLPELESEVSDPEALACLFESDPFASAHTIQRALVRAGTKPRTRGEAEGEMGLVLVLDQLEEFLLLHDKKNDEENRTATNLLRLIRALATAHGVAIWVLATLRSDFYAECAAHPDLVEMTSERGVLHLTPPTSRELVRMIEWPARAAGLSFAIDSNSELGFSLAAALAQEAEHQPECLPLLAFVLRELYERRVAGRLLTFEAYRDLEGLAGAIARRAEEIFAAQSDGVRQALDRVVLPLARVQRDEPGGPLRARAPADHWNRDSAATTLLNALLAGRILVREPDACGGATVSVAHEAVLRQWQRARECIEANRRLLEIGQRISQQCTLWIGSGKHAAYLLPAGLPLEEGRELLRHPAELPDATTRIYIEVSIAAADAAARKRRQTRIVWTAGFLAALGLVAAQQFTTAIRQRNAAERQAAQSYQMILNLGTLTHQLPRQLERLPSARDAVRSVLDKMEKEIDGAFELAGEGLETDIARARYLRVAAEWDWDKAWPTKASDGRAMALQRLSKAQFAIERHIAHSLAARVELAAIARVRAAISARDESFSPLPSAEPIDNAYQAVANLLSVESLSQEANPDLVARARYEQARINSEWARSLFDSIRLSFGKSPKDGSMEYPALAKARALLSDVEDALTSGDKLLGETEGDVDNLRLLNSERQGNVLALMGVIARQRNDGHAESLLREAEARYMLVLELVDSKVLDSVPSIQWLHDAGIAQMNIARVRNWLGEKQEAMDAMDASEKALEELCRREPSSERFVSDLEEAKRMKVALLANSA